ncbi:MAG TPA: cupin domain-containing protein [Solirubrobacteraceae bacterium]|nr:cupin domain-containing protein [Solirubrobacteraceae bacterium]
MHDSVATVIAPGAGEVVGDSPDRRVEILCDHEALAATWSRFGPGRAGADLHVHRRHTDLFYVLEGVLTVMLGAGEEAIAPAGTLVCVPPLVVHGFRNASDAELRYLNFHAPGEGFAEYLRGARDDYDQEPPPPDGGHPAAEAVIGDDGIASHDGMRVLVDIEQIAIAERRIDRGSPPLGSRPHSRRRRSLYVLEGGLALSAGERELWAVAGSWIELPPGVAPSLAPHGSGAARFLDLRTPAGAGGSDPLKQ